MKKYNIGIILIVLTIIFFTIFVIVENKIKEDDMEDALEYIKEYYKLQNKYALLPDGYRDIEKQMPKEEYDKYLAEMKNELSEYVADSQIDVVYSFYKKRLDYQYKGKKVYNQYEITDIEYHNFDKRSRIEDGIIYVYITYKRKTMFDSRESEIIDENIDRYIGNVTKNNGRLDEIGTLIILKKMDNEKFKILYDIAY